MEDVWYQHVVEYLNMGEVKGLTTLKSSELRMIQNKAKHYALIERPPTVGRTTTRKQLAFRERNGSLSQCLHPGQVKKALKLLHDVHGHFATDITMQRAIGRFYWPTRRKDVTYSLPTTIRLYGD